MKCMECGQETRSHRGERELNLGLPYRVVVQDAPFETCVGCGEVYSGLDAPVQTMELVAKWVAERPGRLEPSEVRFLRNASGHTQEEFGQLLGVAAETISRWENGKQALGQQSELTLRMAVLVPAAVLEGVQKETAPPTQIDVSDRKVVLAS
jgi:putative zinc finger/helix-turn-helix YgiT family protein